MYQLQLSTQNAPEMIEDNSTLESAASKAVGYSGQSIDLDAARKNLMGIIEEDGSDVTVEIPAARVLDLVDECTFWKNRTHEMGKIARQLEKILDRNMEMLKR